MIPPGQPNIISNGLWGEWHELVSADIFAGCHYIGLTLAAPIGPINVLCIQRTLTRGAPSGFATAFGCASADATYGAVAAFGMTLVSDFLMREQTIFRLIGAHFLTWLALKSLLRGPALARQTSSVSALIKDVVGTYGLTISNPLTIIIFAALFAGLDPVNMSGNNLIGSVLLTSGVFAGTFGWMSLMIGLSLILRRKLGDKFLTWANRFSVLILLGFAGWLTWSALVG